ncbi:MAG: phosphoglycerate mutase GpmB [Acidimicrobiales bacterium]|nr:MAG: histidine phosphatase family protein [Actinomycetota bacterium]MBV6507502.1 phosphoglycerate mutase GpmB [Acidimicrobiales bacterium]RIK07878.1 MAG: histidine phosphatase family protein [Acidobacteriota bacterium]
MVRHGQSEWNAGQRWQGQADPPLSALGARQARLAAASLDHIEAIVSSDLRRAADTARVIADALGIGPVALEPALRERFAGPWQGLTRDEIERRWPGWLEDGRRPEGYESDAEVCRRSVPALRRIAEHHGGTRVLVVTHGGVIYTIERQMGVEVPRLANLGARSVRMVDDKLVLGARFNLLDGDDITIPSQI